LTGMKWSSSRRESILVMSAVPYDFILVERNSFRLRIQTE
jgi:hypothetical protein